MNSLQESAQQGYELFAQYKNKLELTIKPLDIGEYLISQGQVIKELYWIESGCFTVGHTAKNGRYFSLGRYQARHHLIGEFELQTGKTTQFDVRANEAITVTVIPMSLIIRLMQDEPNVAIWICQSLAEHYQRTFEIMANRILHPLIYNIALDIEQRYLEKKPNINFTQGYKEADRFGCSERVYRRVVSELLEKGFIIKVGSQLKVKDISSLSEFLNV